MKLKKQCMKLSRDHFDQIPDDLAVDILSRLSGKSLMKLRYVSKFWFSIIRSQRLIDSFIPRSLKRGSRFLIAFNNCEFVVKKTDMRLFFFTVSDDEGENKSSPSSLVASLDMTIPSTVDYHYTRGSANDDAKKLTYKYLGYDPIDDQYKAMCMTVSRRGHHGGDVEHKVLTLGGGRGDVKTLSWRIMEDNTEPYVPYTKGTCINGIVYYGATRPNTNGVIVCFDVRFEKISLMNPPLNIKSWEVGTSLINYKGKVAIIHTTPLRDSYEIIVWILENVKTHEWSKKTRFFPHSSSDTIDMSSYSFIGINETREIILAPKLMPRNLEAFYIFYFDLTSQGIRRVRVEGLADDEEFKRHYGIGNNGSCPVSISSEHFENITFF
ncbi:unnamed protein product [Thlaspi arvense]|uniref:F-box domain-containing protein n=1 Tax=Thlaspi arvense TaxID=13288 RepID=A0AAU9RR54_THLAR|nr:unnamed protein product [Thlaspi arvense]